MCEQTEVNYLSGDIVWVKLGPSWWPGEVIDETTLEPEIKNSFKKTPIAVVKFFKEEQFEFVRNLNHIYKYNCRRKHEFIKKGIDMHRAKHAFMDKFPDDVSYAELLTGGDPDIITSDEFAPEQKPDYASIFGTPSHKKSTKVGVRGRASIGASHYSGKLSLSPQRATTHRRFTTNNDHEIRMLQQTTPPATNSNYKCHICGFTSSRLNVIVLHNRSHSNGTFVSPEKQKSAKGMRKGKKTKSFANTSSIDEDLELIRQGMTVTKEDTDSDSDTTITAETTNKPKSSVKRKKKAPKSSSSKKTKVNSICNNLLADWGDSDSAEDLDKTIDESKESGSAKDTSIEENADDDKIKNAEKSKDVDGKTSCFDFQDEEDSTMLEKSPGRKIPRVIPQKRISQDKEPDESTTTVDAVEKSTETKLDNETTPSDQSKPPESPIKPPESPIKPLDEPDLDAFQAILNETAVPQLPDILEIPAKRDQTNKSVDTDEETNKEKTNGVFLETAAKKPGEKQDEVKSDAHLSPKKRYRTFQEFETFVNDQPSSDDASSGKKTDKTHSKTGDKTPSTKTVDKTPSKTVDKTPSKPVDKTPSKTVDKTPSKTVDKTPSKKVEKTPSKKLDKSPVKKGDKTHLKEDIAEEIPTKKDDAIEVPAIKDEEKSTSLKNDDEQQQPLKKSTTLEVSKLKSQLMHKLTETPIHEQPKREPRRREPRKRYSRRFERSPTPEDEPAPIEVTSTTKNEATIITESVSMEVESKEEEIIESIKEPVVDDDKVIETSKVIEFEPKPIEETEETNSKLTKNVHDSGMEIPETTQTFPKSESQEKTPVPPPVLKIEENAGIQSQVEATVEETQPPVVDEEAAEIIQCVEQPPFEKIEEIPLKDPIIEPSDKNEELVTEIAKEEIKTIENESVEDEKKIEQNNDDLKDSISAQIEEEARTESINIEKAISEQETVSSEETVSTQELIPEQTELIQSEEIRTAEAINTTDLLNTEVINTEETISTTEAIDSDILVSTTEVTENTEVTTTRLDEEVPSQSEDSLKIEEQFTEIVQEPIVTSEEVIQESIPMEETSTIEDETRSQKLIADITDICIDNTDNLSGLSTLAAVSELTGSFYEKSELPAQEPTVLDVKELLQSEKPIELPLPRDKPEEIMKEKPKATLSTFSMDFSDSNSESTIIKPEILEAELKKEKKKATTFDSIESELEKMVSLGGSSSDEKLNNFPTIPPPEAPIIYPDFALSETAVETSEFIPKKIEKKSTPTIPPAAPSPSVSSLESEIAKLTDTNPDQESILHEHHQNTSSSKLLEILTDSKSKKSDHIIRPHRTYMPASSSSKIHMVINEPQPSPPKSISKKYDPKTKYVIKSCTTTSSKSGNKMNKPIILSEKIIKPMTETENVSVKKVTSKRSFQDVEDIDTFIISKPIKKQNHGDQLDQKDFVLTPKIEVIRNKGGVMRPRGKPKIIDHTIIKQADVVIPATADPPPLLDDSMFDINSMPIVLSDQILTPESIENMPVVLTDYVPQPQPKPPVIQPEIQPTPTLKRGGAIQHVKLLNKAKVSQPEITPKPVQTVVKNIMPRGYNKNQKIYQASSTKMLKNNPAVITQPGKPGKFIILPSSTTSSPGVSKYTVGKRVPAVKNAPAIANPTTSKYKPPSISEPTGNKIMIVTNNQGVQSRVLLTPAQQKMLGKMPSTKITKSPSQQPKTTLQKSILTSKGTIIAPATQKLPSLASQTIMTSKGQLITTAGQTLVTSEGQVLTPITQQQLKTLKSEQHKFGKKIQSRVLLSDKIAELTPQKPKMNIMSKTKTILIKGSQGQTLKKIQSPMSSSMAEKNIVIQQQQSAAGHKSNQILSQTVGGKQILVNPKGQIINKPDGKTVQKQISEKLHRLSAKQSSTPTRILSKSSKMLSPAPTSSNKQLGSVNIPPLAPITSPTAKKETVLHPKKIAPALLHEKEKLPETMVTADKAGEPKQPNQLIIQDTLGNQTTVTEGQILALPSGETVDGQPQSYMLVTVDESGNLIPISNDALMSLDPTGTNEMSNIVLQFDTPQDTQPQEPTKIETAPVEQQQQFAPVPAQTVEQQIIMDNQIVIPEQTIMTTTAEQIQETFLTQPQDTQQVITTTDPSSFVTENQTAVACNISSGETSQQLIITGDPESTQKFLASLTDGNTDLSSLLSGTDGNIIINADGQQILLNTSTDNSILLSVNPDNLGLIQASTAESDVVAAQNTMYTTQQQVMKNQDILAAALADTDVFQPDVTTDKLITSQSKNQPSQLSPNSSSLYPMSVGNVLETSLTLSSPIMTPLELPSAGAKKINPNVASTLMSQVSSSLELPITITDPNISQTVSQQVMLGAELQTSLELPISMSESVITSIHTSEMSSPSFVYSLPSLDETADLEQKHVFPGTSSTVITTDSLYNTALTGSMSMPLLTEEPEISHEEPEMPATVTSEVPAEISHEQTPITNIELDAQVQSDIHHEMPPVETEVSHMETEISQVEIEMPHMDTEETIVNTETFITNESLVTTSASETVISTEASNIQQVETTEVAHIESEPSSHIETEVRQVEIEPPLAAHIEEDASQIEPKPSHTETELQHIETDTSHIETDTSHIETELQQFDTQSSSHIDAELQHIETQSSHIDTEHVEIETSASLPIETEQTHIDTEQTHIEIESSHIQTEPSPIEIASSHPETEQHSELEQIAHDETKLSHVETEVPHAEIESAYVETTESSHIHTEEVVPHVETEHSHTESELLGVETTKSLEFDAEIIQTETEPLQFETEITSSHNTEIETTQIEHDETQMPSIETDVVSHVETETESTHIQPETTHLETEIQHEITEEERPEVIQEEISTVDSGLTLGETEIIPESQEVVEQEVVSQIEEIPQPVPEMVEEPSVTITQDYISGDIPITCSSETVITESIVTESADQLSNNYLDIAESDEMKAADTKSDGIHFHQFGLNTGDVCNSLSEPPPGLYGGVSFLNVLDDDVANIPLPEETVPHLSRAKKLKLCDDFVVEQQHHSSNIEMDLNSPRFIDDENSSEIPIQPEIVTNLSETSFGEYNSQEKRKQDDGGASDGQEMKRRKISSD